MSLGVARADHPLSQPLSFHGKAEVCEPKWRPPDAHQSQTEGNRGLCDERESGGRSSRGNAVRGGERGQSRKRMNTWLAMSQALLARRRRGPQRSSKPRVSSSAISS